MKNNTKVLAHNAELLKSFTKSLDEVALIVAEHKVTGYMLIVNYDETFESLQPFMTEETKKDINSTYELHAHGDIQKLLSNIQSALLKTALKIRQDSLNKNPKLH